EGEPLHGGQDGFAATQLFRIAQEAVNNALKHARARNIRIGLVPDGRHATLEVTDDGIGIREPAATNSGIGLRIMRYRADLINAALTIQKGDKGGTKVSCTFFLEQPHEI